MWAKWQIGQVAAEPGASICHKDAPEATSSTAMIAAATLAPCNHRIFLVRVIREWHRATTQATVMSDA